MLKVTVQAESRFPVNRGRVRQAVNKVVVGYGLKEAVVNVVVVGDRKMTALNRRWMNQSGTTDVLAFPMEEFRERGNELGFVMPSETPLILGDVVVSYPMAVEQAADRNVLVDDEIDALVDHGVRHLLGEHHD